MQFVDHSNSFILFCFQRKGLKFVLGISGKERGGGVPYKPSVPVVEARRGAAN